MGTFDEKKIYKIYNNIKLPVEHTNKLIYHYTSPDGLCNILQTKSLYATDINYLNDKSEGIYGIKLLEEEMGDLFAGKESVITHLNYEIESAKRDLASNYLFHTYTISFSLNQDSLGMWNYYTKGNAIQGYNIGYNVSKLVKNLHIIVKDEDEKKIDLVGGEFLRPIHGKVIYSKKKQKAILKQIISEFTKDFEQYKGNEFLIETIAYLIVRKILFISVFFKDEYFASEKEYRIAFNATLISENDYQKKGVPYRELFRVVNGNIIPYQICSFDVNAVKSITCSPTLDSRETVESVKRLLLHDYKDVQKSVYNSRIPVRY